MAKIDTESKPARGMLKRAIDFLHRAAFLQVALGDGSEKGARQAEWKLKLTYLKVLTDIHLILALAALH